MLCLLVFSVLAGVGAGEVVKNWPQIRIVLRLLLEHAKP